MKKIIIRDYTNIAPFNEPVRDLRIMNKPLWLYQRDVLSPYCQEELECNSWQEMSTWPASILEGELVVYRDNLFFDEFLFKEFITAARDSKKPAQIAFSQDDAAIVEHALQVQEGIRLEGDVYVADLFYYPDGAKVLDEKPEPIVVDTKPREMGFYHVPTYMANESGELVFNVPTRAFLSIENWVHVFMANSVFGIWAHGARTEESLDNLSFMARVFWRSLLERKQFLSSSPLVIVGKNTQIDPAAIIQGPTIIGDNVTIGPGAVINASIIGNNVNIWQGCQILLSVVGDGCELFFRAALLLTTMMSNSMVAQNTCLQLCVVGRNTFIGAGNTFTDYNLLAKPLKVWHKDKLQEVGLPALGGCVGHNCRIGSGHIFFPARSVESDVVMFARQDRTVVTKNVKFEDSDHHNYPGAGHIPMYHHDETLPEEEEQSTKTTEELLKST